MVAGMAGYIAKNKIRPRPEWQKTVTPAADASNPFKIVYSTSSGPRPAPHPMLSKRFPLVLMLEPLHACNLTCTGCGRIREYENTITQRLSLDQCMAADAECGAPTVSICGGEPMLYPEIGELSRRLVEDRGRNVILCTNGMFMKKKIGEFKPNDVFFFNIHLDGMEKNHDIAVEREGVFKQAIEGLQIAKAAGFKVMSNTTVYKETDMNEIWELFEYLETLGMDAHTISPAYGYSAVNDQEIFLTRDDIHLKFKDIDKMQKRFPIINSPIYSDFLKGERDLPCTVWGSPTYNVKGWKGPCYAITDAHYQTFEEFMTHTPWGSYGPGNDPRCEHCMMHVGFEPSAAMGANSKMTDGFKSLTWLLG